MIQVNVVTMSNQNLVSELLAKAWRVDPDENKIEDNARWQRCIKLYQEIIKRLEKE